MKRLNVPSADAFDKLNIAAKSPLCGEWGNASGSMKIAAKVVVRMSVVRMFNLVHLRKCGKIDPSGLVSAAGLIPLDACRWRGDGFVRLRLGF